MILRYFAILTIIFSGITLPGQTRYTPYDYIPGIIRAYKPAYDSAFPDWGKMLYEYPVNYNEISGKFEKYISQHKSEKSPIIRYYKIWDRIVGGYVQDNGHISLPDIDAVYTKMTKTQIAAKPDKAPGDADWTFLGPKETFWLNTQNFPVAPLSCPWQVNVYSFNVAANDPGVLYCGTETGYMNKTTDAGLNWQLLAKEYPFGGGITAVAIHPANSDIVYAAAGNQIHKTTDGGLTWIPLLQDKTRFYPVRLLIDGQNPSKLFSASADGVHVSTDGGETWIKKWNYQSWDVEIKPDNPSIIYALSKSIAYFRLAVSYDGGATFEEETSFPSGIIESSGGLLAVTPAAPDRLYVILLSADNTPYLYLGTIENREWTWELLATGRTPSFAMNNGQGFFDLAMEVAPDNPEIILVGTTTLYKSLNGGNSFTAVGGYTGNFSIHPDIQDLKMLPDGNTWVATDGGMNLTTDYFATQAHYHVRVNGLTGSDMWGFDQGWNEDIVVGGRYHNGNTAIADFYQPKALRMGGAESPTGWVLKGKSRHVAFNDLGNGWILPATAETPPEGRFLFTKYPNMDEYGGRRGNLVSHPNYYGTLYLGENNGFWKSTDMGTSWELLYTFPGRVRYLQISFRNPDVFYADIVNQGLYKSEDGGYNWVLKPSLCNAPYGSNYWKGKLFFAVSPYDENVLYACLQNGTWSADIGKVFRSQDGGDTWEEWTGTLQEYTKNLCIQPSIEGSDIVYLFTTSREGLSANVYYRTAEMDDWAAFGTGYPAGMSVNLALPFFRDGKIRVAGNAGVWESPLLEPDFTPIVNPWVERPFFDCMDDTIRLDDHSMLNHNGATWHWDIIPEPVYMEDANMRNPKVVLGNPGAFSVTLTVTKNGESYSKTIPGMITTETCPSVEDCDNPAELPKDEWELLYVDSEELNYPGLAVMSFDDDTETIWHTQWSNGSTPYPHEIQIALEKTYRIYSFTYLTRQDGQNGRIKDYELYIGKDPDNWGTPVTTGSFVNTVAPQTIEFPDGINGNCFRLVALSEVNGNPWASAAEFSLVGCTDTLHTSVKKYVQRQITAFPVPTSGNVFIPLPGGKSFTYQIINASGHLFDSGTITGTGNYGFDFSPYPRGIYLIKLMNNQGNVFLVKILKE